MSLNQIVSANPNNVGLDKGLNVAVNNLTVNGTITGGIQGGWYNTTAELSDGVTQFGATAVIYNKVGNFGTVTGSFSLEMNAAQASNWFTLYIPIPTIESQVNNYYVTATGFNLNGTGGTYMGVPAYKGDNPETTLGVRVKRTDNQPINTDGLRIELFVQWSYDSTL